MRAFVQLSQPCIEVAANGREAGAGKQPSQLRDAPHAPGSDRGRLPQARH